MIPGIIRREHEILSLLASGFTTKQIAIELFITESTVVTHRENLKRKLYCSNCPELVFKASTLGLILNHTLLGLTDNLYFN